jgi:uncharacterized protein
VNYFCFDASALGKRYVEEVGSDLIDELFDNVPLERLMALVIGALEVFSILVRKRNGGRITPADFSQATSFLNQEVIADDSDFELLPTPDSSLQTAINFVENYAINATDALVLCSALETAARLQNIGDELVFVASDKRLLRAARAEGLRTFNPAFVLS